MKIYEFGAEPVLMEPGRFYQKVTRFLQKST